MQSLSDRFDKFHDDEYIQFSRIDSPACLRPDLCAFLRLNELCPSNSVIVSCAEHDQIWLSVDCDEFNNAASDDDILMLTRCGVIYDENTDSLSMFV